jgi:hypothetical protein
MLEKKNPTEVKKAKILICKFSTEWLNPITKKIIYYHSLILDNGDVGTIGKMENLPKEISIDSIIEYTISEDGKIKIISSSNDSKENDKSVSNNDSSKSFKQKNRIKGQEAFLGYAWSYAKDLIIAGKTSKDLKELDKVAEHIYNKIGEMLEKIP